METKIKTEKHIAPSTEDGTITTEAAGEIPMLPPAGETNGGQQIGNSFSGFLAQLPAYISRFFEAYKQPIINLALILAAIVSLRVLFAVVDALNDVPLFLPFFELIGMSYTAWFVYRYLLKAEKRQELAAKIQSFKQEILGNNSEELS